MLQNISIIQKVLLDSTSLDAQDPTSRILSFKNMFTFQSLPQITIPTLVSSPGTIILRLVNFWSEQGIN